MIECLKCSGEDAYTSLKLKNAVFEAWEVAGVVIGGDWSIATWKNLDG